MPEFEGDPTRKLVKDARRRMGTKLGFFPLEFFERLSEIFPEGTTMGEIFEQIEKIRQEFPEATPEQILEKLERLKSEEER